MNHRPMPWLVLALAAALASCAAPPRTEVFEVRLEAATAAMDEAQWQRAADLLADAHRESWSEESHARAETCRDALAAMRAVKAGREKEARQRFRDAESRGFAAAALEDSRRRLLAHTYTVVIHSAAVLPHDPETSTPWDGPPVAVKDASRLIAGLVSLFVDGGFAVSVAADYIVRTVSASLEPPDCLAQVTLGEAVLCRSGEAVEDSYHPVWDLSFDVHTTTLDETPVSVLVLDEDLVDHDDVGTWHLTLGELVRVRGVREIPLVDSSGTTRAGGIAGLRISVRAGE